MPAADVARADVSVDAVSIAAGGVYWIEDSAGGDVLVIMVRYAVIDPVTCDHIEHALNPELTHFQQMLTAQLQFASRYVDRDPLWCRRVRQESCPQLP